MPKLRHTHTHKHRSTVGHVKLNVADEDKCKSHLVTENESHSSRANLAGAVDSRDTAGLIPHL